MRKKLLAAGSALLLVAGLISLGAGSASASTTNTNDPGYWQAQYPNAVSCYKYDSDGGAHGTVTNNGQAVTLNTFQQAWPGDRWEVLIVKGGAVDYGAGDGNVVYPLPKAGTPYFAPLNNGGQQSGVSHWIVCKGATPATPPTEITELVAPTASDVCGTADDVLTVPDDTSKVDYEVVWNQAHTEATVTATAKIGFVLKAGLQHVWTFTFTDVPCVTPPTDVCANINGIQTTVPADMVQVGAACLPFQLPPMAVVTPTVVSNNITCTAGGSYTLGEADGITDAIVWKVDGNLVTAGTHAVTTAGTHTVTAVPGDGHGFDFGIDNPSSWVLSFTAPQDCGDLTTLALPGETLASTGTDGGSVYLGLLFAGGLLMLGGALVIAEKRLKFGRK